MQKKCFAIVLDGISLACQPAGNGSAKAWVGYPVGGAGDGRQEAARQLVLALGTAFEALRSGCSWGIMRGFAERWMSGLSRTPGKRV